MAKRFYDNEFAAAATAEPYSSSARIVTAGNAIAARRAASPPDSDNGAVPTAGTNKVRKAGSIIGTGSNSTGHAAANEA